MTLTDVLQQLDAVRQQASRVGEHWPQGPIASRSTAPVGMEDLRSWITEITSTEHDLANVYRQVRRVHYSSHVRWPLGKRRGARLDALLAGDDVGPLTWSNSAPGVTPGTLDNLSASGMLALEGAIAGPVDIGSLFTALDAAFYGASLLGTTAEITTGLAVDGVVTWVGDLAAWFLAWYAARTTAEGTGVEWTQTDSAMHLDTAQATEVPLELMLGSIDGTNLAMYVGSTIPTSINAVPPPQDLLDRYYNPAPPVSLPEGHPRVDGRWARFVHVATPPIPHSVSSDTVELAEDASSVVAGYVSLASAFMLHHAARDKAFRSAVSAPVMRPGSLADAKASIAPHEATIRLIADRFIELLEAGITGSAVPDSWLRSV